LAIGELTHTKNQKRRQKPKKKYRRQVDLLVNHQQFGRAREREQGRGN